ncbi:MAG: fatty acid desaturase, partial [Polyangiaceae bacterium]|nr:fatty acid desaturase [Polyangiaceae bacterium]
RWGRACTAAGYATAWIVPNPISALLLSQGRLTRWAMVAHHVSHGGYDRVPGTPESRRSRGFARGLRRFVDWLDWIDPEAWAHEHNRLHHYRLGEREDPDLVEENLRWLRDASLPMAAKLAVVGLFAGTWKLTYYAPNTLRVLRAHAARKRPIEDDGASEDEPSIASLFADWELWKRCILPYAGAHFVAAPLLFAPLGPFAAWSVLVNSLLAEVLTNLHAFVVITTNHAGEDLWAFDGPITEGKGEFYYRQVVGSTNFRTGSDGNDFLHGFLNYQIEHHVFPQLPMRQYQRIKADVQRICEAHGVPYVQESVWKRLARTLDIMVGRTSMKRA